MYKAANWSGKGFASRQNLMEKLQSKTKTRYFFLNKIKLFDLRRISPTGHHATT